MSKVGKAHKKPIFDSWQCNVLVLSTLVKLLLVPSYHSTDFEVHRHWLALTNTLPISQWYFDETSQWTLDYPPFFGYFSWILSVPAKLWDPKIVDLKEGLEYQDWKCVLFMRLTVIATELVLAAALFALERQSNWKECNRIPGVVAAALLLHPGLLIVDHIHFQFNGFLFGILLWSVWAAREVR
jgi:alpha-1,3-glucosyltransferase